MVDLGPPSCVVAQVRPSRNLYWLVACALAVLTGLTIGFAQVSDAAAESPLRRFDMHGGKQPLPPIALPELVQSLSAGECESCHIAEAREWQESKHRQSWTSALFQEAYRIEPMPECRNCHQPLTAGKSVTAAVKQLRNEGINCAVCHVRNGSVLSPRRSGRAPHAVQAAPVMSESAFCGSCHQFNFPEHRADSQVHHTNEPMQDTLREWERLRSASTTTKSCQDCHMQWEGVGSQRHRSHRFFGGYDHSMLQKSVAVSAESQVLPEAVEVRIQLSAQDTGHAVPTGDLYRCLVLVVSPVDGAGHEVAPAQERRLQRQFISTVEADEQGRLRVQRRQVEDNRLMPGVPQDLLFRFPMRTQAVNYRLSLSRIPPGAAATDNNSISQITAGRVAITQGVGE